jgi:adenylate cyclase
MARFTSYFEDRFYDFRMLLTLNEKNFEKKIVLAAIDDDSLKHIGRWPWTRTVHAELLRKLKVYGAKTVAFDVFFSEEEKACNAISPDIDLANAIADFQSIEGNKVLLPYSVNTFGTEYFKEGEMPDVLFDFVMDSTVQGGAEMSMDYLSKSVFPLPVLLEKTPLLGHIQATEDADGIMRHYKLVATIDSLTLPAFSLEAYESFTGDKPKLEISQFDTKLKIKNGTLKLNAEGESKVRWFGGAENFPTVPIHKILTSKDDDPKMKELLTGKMIFIGSTAYAAHDLRHTPIDAKLPGIFFHMNMMKMLIDGNFFKSREDSTIISWGILIGATLIMILVQFFGHAVWDLFTVSFLTLGLFLYDTFFLTPQGHEIKLFFCLFSVVACYSFTTFLNFYITSREKKKIRGTFSRFVSPAVVNEMLENPDMVKVGGEKKNITVFFSDVRDFTSISEKLTPEQLSSCLNQYMGIMTDIIFEHKGTLDKYIGDAIVAFWGAPIGVENHPYWAIKAAIKMIDELPKLNARFVEQGYPQLKHGIGLNSGECSVGNMGSDKIFSYTALGDNMNLGARLESLCKYYGVQLNISEMTLMAVPEELRKEFTYRILDKVKVKGKDNAVQIYEVLHTGHELINDMEALMGYNKSFELYQERKFETAIMLLGPIHEKYPNDKPTKRIIEICEEFIKTPPSENWDGVFTHTSK